MPIYEYVCDNCSHHLEALQKMSDEPLVFCPECGEAGLRKQVSAAAFRLKGTGWYETDFKSGKKKNVSGSEDKAGGETSLKSESGSSDSGSKTETKSGSSSDKTASKAKSSSKSGDKN